MAIVYKTTDLNTGNIYIGVDRKNNPDYFGSGINIQRIIDSRGTHQLYKETLAEFDNDADAFAYEAELVTEEFIKRDDVLNKNVGGYGGWQAVNISGANVKNIIGSIWVHLDGKSRRIKQAQLPEFIKQGYKVGRYKERQMRIFHEELDMQKTINAKDFSQYEKDGWINSIKTDGPTTGLKWVHNKNTGERKNIKPCELQTYIDLGWTEGSGRAGNKWINKNYVRKSVKADEVEAYLKMGWSPGLGPRNKPV